MNLKEKADFRSDFKKYDVKDWLLQQLVNENTSIGDGS